MQIAAYLWYKNCTRSLINPVLILINERCPSSMNDSLLYCPFCGKPLNSGSRFCGECGKALPADEPQAAAPTPAPAVYGETILGIIPGAGRKKGFLGFGRDMFHIIVTDQRLIFAHQTMDMMKANTAQAKEQAKQQGQGLLSQMGAMMGANTGGEYFEMQPQDILREQPLNFFIYNNQVNRIKIKFEMDDESSHSEHNMEIKTGAGETKLVFTALDEKSARGLLRQAVGAALK